MTRAVPTGLALVLTGALSGCLNLKPVVDTTRYFVLDSVSPSQPEAPSRQPSPRLGLGPVTIPSYLNSTWMAVRRGPGEIDYLESSQWAERLDEGLLRVIATDLAAMLPTDQVHLLAWTRAMVDFQIYVTVDRFESDRTGKVELVARWLVNRPGEDRVLASNTFRGEDLSSSQTVNPEEIVVVMNRLLGTLSLEIAQAVKGLAVSPPPSPLPTQSR